MAGNCTQHVVQLLWCWLVAAECNHRPRRRQVGFGHDGSSSSANRAVQETTLGYKRTLLKQENFGGCRFSRSTPPSPGILSSWRPANPRTLTRAWPMSIFAVCSPSLGAPSYGQGRRLQAHRPLLDAVLGNQQRTSHCIGV